MTIKSAVKSAKSVKSGKASAELNDLRIKDEELIAFTESLRDLLESGLPINQILNQMKTSTRNERFAEAISRMLRDVENGLLLSQAMERYARVFNEDYRSLIQAAEKSGRWTRSRGRAENSDGILEMLLKYLKRRGSTRERVKSGLLYPAIIGIAIIASLCAFAFYVIPALKDLFSAIQTADSIFIRMLFAFADFAENYWWTAPIAAALGGYALWHYYNFAGGREAWMKYQLRLKGIGPIFMTMLLAETSWLLGTLFTAGLTPQEVLSTAADSSRNSEIAAALRRAKEMLFNGVAFCDALKECHRIFEEGQTYMILSSAQKNGNLGTALEAYAERLFEKLDHKLDRLVRTIEPAMICIAGVVVGLIAITFYGSLSAAIANLAAR